MLKIWGRPNSHNVKKVVWCAQELDIPFERTDMGNEFGFTPEYLAMNPNRLIPTIEDGDLVLWESNAILRYLAAKYGPPAFWSEDPAVRAQGDKWMDWQFTFADAMRDGFINLVRKPRGERHPSDIARSGRMTGELMAILDATLAAQPWLSGDEFGLADIPMGTYAHTWFTLDIERPDLPNVADWYRRLQSRPGYASQVMIPLT